VADDTRLDTESVHDPTALDPEADLVSQRRARKWWWALGGFALVAILALMYVGGQSESDAPVAPKAFCKAAKAFEDELTRTEAEYDRSLERQLPLVADLAATAPRAVRADAQLWLTQMEAIAAAPNEQARARLRDDPDVKVAVDNVNRYATQGCGFFDRQSGI
jgi:hypothetical protein